MGGAAEHTDALRCIVYGSTAAAHWSESALAALAEQSGARNGATAITGQLAYDSGHFVQVLEGPPDAVDALFERIRHDPRHTDIQLILRRDVPTRAFPGWAMRRAPSLDEAVRADIDAAVAAVQTPDVTQLVPDLVGGIAFDRGAAPGLSRPRLPVQQDRAGQTVARIVDAARRLLLARGGPGFDVPELAEAAGVTRATLYRYFPDTASVLRTTLRRLAMMRLAEWQAAIERTHFVSERHLAEMIASLGTRNLLNVRNAPQKLITAAIPYLDSELPTIADAFAETVLAALTRSGLPAAGRITRQDLAAMLHGLFAMALAVGRQDVARLRTERTRQIGLAMLLAGFQAAADDAVR